jgi:hypothetical protein
LLRGSTVDRRGVLRQRPSLRSAVEHLRHLRGGLGLPSRAAVQQPTVRPLRPRSWRGVLSSSHCWRSRDVFVGARLQQRERMRPLRSARGRVLRVPGASARSEVLAGLDLLGPVSGDDGRRVHRLRTRRRTMLQRPLRGRAHLRGDGLERRVRPVLRSDWAVLL